MFRSEAETETEPEPQGSDPFLLQARDKPPPARLTLDMPIQMLFSADGWEAPERWTRLQEIRKTARTSESIRGDHGGQCDNGEGMKAEVKSENCTHPDL